ncbi:fibronectin type III domain-containing protein [Flavobacterium sp.]|uniref:fibronectin type III domain-containing protein n=1 Tax=Flavobacterium sp. TaxID=239 RepID=UPI0039E33563
MKLKFNLILLVLFAFSAKAQQVQLFTASADKSIRVKWLSKKIEPNASYDLMRRANGGNWEQINNQPIVASPVIAKSELNSSKNPFPKDSAYAMYVEYKTSKETTPNKQAYADYTLTMAAVFDNKLAAHMGIFFEDKTVETGKKYQYKLMQVQKEIAVSAEIALGDLSSAPTNFKVKQDQQKVRFDWKASEEFISYNLYRNGTKINSEPILANLEGKAYVVSYSEENPKPGNYKYALKGVTYLNTESKSAEITVEIKDQTPPAAVKGFKVERKENEIAMQWTASADKDLKGYSILRSDDKGKTFQKINAQLLDAKTTQYSEKISANFGTLQYYIEAEDQAGNKTPSVKTSIFVPDHEAPEMPKSLTSRSESGKITMSWAANSEKDLAGYRIYRGLKDDDENSMLLLNVKPQTATTFIDTFPKKAKTKFIYKVTAIDKAFNESPKASAWVQLPDIVAPDAPVLQEPILNGTEITLNWDLVVTDAIAGYDVYRIFDGQKAKVTPAKVTVGNFIDKTATRKGLYQYYVQAIDSASLESKPSNSVYINTSASKTSGVQLMLSQDARTKKVQIEIVGIEPAEVQRVKLFRKDGDSGFRMLPFQYSASVSTDETSEAGNIYEYFVEVVDHGDQKFKSDAVIFNNP